MDFSVLYHELPLVLRTLLYNIQQLISTVYPVYVEQQTIFGWANAAAIVIALAATVVFIRMFILHNNIYELQARIARQAPLSSEAEAEATKKATLQRLCTR